MQLSFGAGFLVLIFFIVRPLIRINNLLTKIDYLADRVENLIELFDEYVRKPAQIISKVLGFVTPFLFHGKK